MTSDVQLTTSLASSSNDNSLSIPDFVEPVEPFYRCVNCHKPSIQFFQTTCGHRVCPECVDQLRKLHADGRTFQCPWPEDDRCQLMSVDEIKPDFSARRFMLSMIVFCYNKPLGCTETVKWRDVKEHIASACLYSITVCPNNCGSTALKRWEIDHHLKTSCSKELKNCHFYTVGCKFEGTTSAIEDHWRENVGEHLRLTLGRVNVLETSFAQLVTLCQRLGGNLEHSKIQCSELTSTINTLRTQLQVLNSYKFEQATELTRTQDRVTNIERLVQKNVCSKSETSSVSAIPEDFRLQMISHDRTVAIHDVRLAELDLRLQCTETTNYDGVLIWKIADFRRRKAEARSGGVLSLYSQPFYTSRYGYKLCARVYLNGDGSGRGSHVSFFLVVMQGDYDELLVWPFRQRVTLCLMDQRTQRRHLADTFRPDPNSSSFQKPTNQMNVASGCPQFIEHAKLEVDDSPFLVNDTVFFKIVIDTSDLLNP